MRWQRGQGKNFAFGNRLTHELYAAGKILTYENVHVCVTSSSGHSQHEHYCQWNFMERYW